MIGNKISSSRLIFPVLLGLLVAPAHANAVDPQGYFSVTQFNLGQEKSPEEIEAEKRKSSPLNTDLIYRVSFGRAADVSELLKQGADPNAVNASNISVLSTAIYRKDDEAEPITRALLEYGANPNLPTNEGSYPVLEVVKGGRADVLQTLINHKAVLTYVRDDKGRDLRELAETRGDQSILAVLIPALDAEQAQIETLRSPENFISMVQDYAFLSCANEYLNYYISTNPEGVDMFKFNKIIADNGREVNDMSRRIRYIFTLSDKEFIYINRTARKEVVKQLRDYGSNHARRINGVGTDKDLNNRCRKIAKKWNSRSMNKNVFKNSVNKK